MKYCRKNHNKKFISALLIAITITTSTGQVFAAQNISDKAHSSWAKSAITAMAEKDLIPPKLMSQSNFKEDITREEFAELIVTLYEHKNGQLSNYKKGTFNDTSNPYIEKASALGIVAGFPGGIFKPDQKLTRQEMAVMFSTMLNSDKVGDEKVLSKYSDFQEISSWAKHGAYQSTLHNIMTGDSTGKFNPKANLSRQEAISVVNNYLLQGKTPPVITPPITLSTSKIEIISGDAEIKDYIYQIITDYPANSVPLSPSNSKYIELIHILDNGTMVDINGVTINGIKITNKEDKESKILSGKIEMNSEIYPFTKSVKCYVFYTGYNGETMGAWHLQEMTASGDFSVRYYPKSVKSAEIKAIILSGQGENYGNSNIFFIKMK